MDEDVLIPLVIMTSLTLIILGSVVATQWRKLKSQELETDLKAEMIQRGMSADEVERVLAAKLHGEK